MKKLLLICSAVAMMCGDCAWGMGEDESRENLLQQSQQSRMQKIRKIASKGIQRAKNLFKRKKFQTQATQTNQTTDSIPIEQIPINSRQVEENMDRLVKHEPDHYNLFHYEKMQNSAADEGFSTPTEIVTYPDGDPKIWSDISEIRYANDASYDKLENPKVILYRNKDNSCYIILRIQENKHGVFYGINESHIKLGGKSFSVYDVSEDMGSFTDGVARMIYVDESGLYFVSANENPIEDVIETYQNEGKFNFKGSVIKVSAIDGTITLDGKPITRENFFDNWVVEESHAFQRTKNGFVGMPPSWNKIVLSTKQPKSDEIIRNFYPPNGRYKGIYFQKVKNERGEYRTESMNSYRGGISWLDSFVNKRLSQTKATNKNGAEELVRDGTFASILSLPNEEFISFGSMLGSNYSNPGYYQKVYDAVAAQVVAAKKEQPQTGFSLGSSNSAIIPKSISEMVSQNPVLFKNPDFVRKLKPAFAELEKDYEHNKESELWVPFEIVRNL